MPKQKTNKSLAKRVHVTGSGKIMRGHCKTGHLKTNKTHKQNVALSKQTTMHPTDIKRCKRLIANIL